MAFEGVEKKVELLLTPGAPSLRDRPPSYWKDMVRVSQAEVLSSISNTACDAYLLSESSLFVFPNRMIMITCGQTRLIDTVERLLDDFPLDAFQSLIYERKNELYPGKQPTTFSTDVNRLAHMVNGESHVFGNPQEHHLSLFHLNRKIEPELNDVTTELLMYDLTPSTQARFRRGSEQEPPLKLLGFEELFPKFEWDDHLFEPAGYSLNGIHGDRYITVHITPDIPGSYASLETNYRVGSTDLEHMWDRVLGLLQPARFDLICFENNPQPPRLSPTLGVLQDTDFRTLRCGYSLHFFHYRATGQ